MPMSPLRASMRRNSVDSLNSVPDGSGNDVQAVGGSLAGSVAGDASDGELEVTGIEVQSTRMRAGGAGTVNSLLSQYGIAGTCNVCVLHTVCVVAPRATC
jgi:hypothetical protein